jgi:hypothetical protein
MKNQNDVRIDGFQAFTSFAIPEASQVLGGQMVGTKYVMHHVDLSNGLVVSEPGLDRCDGNCTEFRDQNGVWR